MRRTLTVILASDVAGYSRLVAANEEDTIRRFSEAADVFTKLVEKYHGTVFNTAGDAILANFDSAVEATRCALDVQDANNATNAGFPDTEKLLFRIGIAIGDVLVTETGDLLGDAVNIAARLENVAEPGGICISDDVRTQVLNKIRLSVIDLGDQNLRNLPRAVRAYKLVAQVHDGDEGRPRWRRPMTARFAWLASGFALAGLAAIAATAWYLDPWSHEPKGPPAETFDHTKVPLVTDQVRDSLATYLKEPEHKALVISREGWGVSFGAADAAAARREAMGRCRARDQKGYCRIYAVGDKVVMTKQPPPLPADFHQSLLGTRLSPDDGRYLGRSFPKQRIEEYLAKPDHKAVAIIQGGMIWATSNRTSESEAARLATERCTDSAQSACVLLTIDGLLTIQIPHTYEIKEAFSLAGELSMSEADKQRIGEIYQGNDWRALARGGGHWYAVGDMESETAAVDAVLKLCRNTEQDCSLYAIGNFLVGELLP